MKTLQSVATLWIVTFLTLNPVDAAQKDKDDKNRDKDVETILSGVSRPELPAAAAALVLGAKAQEHEAIALAAVNFVAGRTPAGITPVVSALVKAAPETAPAVAAAAVKLVPSEGPAIIQAATQAAPGFAEQIARAVGAPPTKVPGDPGPPQVNPNGNRPAVPPGLVGTTKPGTIHGNRPITPPGHVRDPMPGRDPQRRRYGSP